MSGKYAADTKVSSAKSKQDIEATLRRYGATGFLFGEQDNKALVAFSMKGRQIRFVLTMPNPMAREFAFSSRGLRPDHVRLEAWEQACRQKWRALLLVIKAKLEAVEAGISVFEDEFLANTVLPDGQLVGNWMRPQVEEAYRIGQMPAMLPMLPAPE